MVVHWVYLEVALQCEWLTAIRNAQTLRALSRVVWVVI